MARKYMLHIESDGGLMEIFEIKHDSASERPLRTGAELLPIERQALYFYRMASFNEVAQKAANGIVDIVLNSFFTPEV